MPSSTACVTAIVPRRLTASTKSHSSSSVLTKNEKRSVPALFTSTSTSPTAATPARIDSTSVTSIRTAVPSISLATLRAPASLTSATATRAPSAASRRAVAAPMPDAPPVTSALRPSSRIAAQRIACAAMPDQVTVIGGSGALGTGLALRLAAAGVPVVIGSRDQSRAEEAAQRVREKLAGAQVQGLANGPAAEASEIVFLCVPFRNQSETLTNLKNHLREGQLVVDATVPLAAAVSGKATRTLGVWQGSAAQQAAEMVPEGV